MDPLSSFRAEGEYAGKVCQLRKSLYGLKQFPRAWLSKFSEVILSMNFTRCHFDHTCFIHPDAFGQCIILLVYFDDIIITNDDTSGIATINLQLGKFFDIKDRGQLKYLLGIKVATSKQGISLSQMKYVLDLSRDTGMLWCKPRSTLMDTNTKTSAES